MQLANWRHTPLATPPLAMVTPLVPIIMRQLLALMRGAQTGPRPL